MATFYGGNLAGPTEMGDALSSGLKAGMEWRAAEKSKKLDELFAKHTRPNGGLDENNFVKDATSAGLGRAEIEQAAQYHANQTQTALANETARRQMQMMLVDPGAAGRNGAQSGEAQPIKISSPSMDGASPPSGPTAIDADKLRSPSEVGGVPQTASTAREAAPAPAGGAQDGKQTMAQVWEWLNSGDKAKVAEAQKAIGAKPDGIAGKDTAKAFFDAAHASGWKSWGGQAPPAANEVQVTAQAPASKGEEARMAPDTVGPDSFVPAQDNRSYLQKIEDSERPLPLGGGGASGSQAPPPPDLTKADPQEVAALARVLRMQLGYKGNDVAGPEMQAALNRLWESEYGKVMAKKPAVWVTGSDGKPDMMKTFQAQHAWEGERQAFPATMAEKLQSLTKEGGVTIPGEKLTQQGTALGNRQKGNELARTTDSTLGVDSSIMDPSKLGELRDRMGKWKTLAGVAKAGGGEGPAGQESYRATVEKFGQLAEGIAPTMEGSRLVQRISQQAGPWQSYLQEGKVSEGVKQYFLAQSMGTATQRKQALNEMLGTLRESIANDAQAYSSRNGERVAQNARNALKFEAGHAQGGVAKPAPSGWVRGPDGVLRRAK